MFEIEKITGTALPSLALAAVLAITSCTSSDTRPAKAPPGLEKPRVVTAEQWGSDPLPIPKERKHTPKFITIHHAGVEWKAGSDPYEKIRNLQAWGKKTVDDGGKDWPDLPYHFLISPDGRIFEGRPVAYEPETNTNYDVRGHIGVQLWGNFQQQRVSPQQIASATRLVAWLSQEYGVDDALIRGHRDAAEGTSCPGADVYRYIEDGQFLGWVESLRAGEEPDIDLGPPLTDGPTEMIPLSQ